jgi:hypothetical protein
MEVTPVLQATTALQLQFHLFPVPSVLITLMKARSIAQPVFPLLLILMLIKKAWQESFTVVLTQLQQKVLQFVHAMEPSDLSVKEMGLVDVYLLMSIS